jgi:radical SAM protein with 4Fe4S-binding SPASM domain
MELSLFRKIIDDLGGYAFTLVLHNWGEPLLNKDIYSMIQYVKQKHIKVILSSNLNILRDKDAEALVNSGLDELIVSLDGVTPESYEKYRKGGNYRKVIKNIEMLVRKKEEMKSNKPKIIWQFLVFKHNVHEVPKVKMMGKQLKVDDVVIVSAQLGGPGQTPYLGDRNAAESASKWLVPDKRFKGEFDYFSNPDYLSRKKCYFLWKTVTINWDGSVSPCCCVYEPSTDFGNVKEERIDQIWNNDLYMRSRVLFSKNNKRIPRGHTICAACKVFKKP